MRGVACEPALITHVVKLFLQVRIVNKRTHMFGYFYQSSMSEMCSPSVRLRQRCLSSSFAAVSIGKCIATLSFSPIWTLVI